MLKQYLVLNLIFGILPMVGNALTIQEGQTFGITVRELYGTMSCAINQETTIEGEIAGDGSVNKDFKFTADGNSEGYIGTLECKVLDDAKNCFGWTLDFWVTNSYGQRQKINQFSSKCCGDTCLKKPVRDYFGERIHIVGDNGHSRMSRASQPSYFPPSPMALERMR